MPTEELPVVLRTVEEALIFIQSGNARIQLTSAASGNSYRYWIRESSKGKSFFVSVITISGTLAYLGTISDATLGRTAKSRVSEAAPVYRAFAWMWSQLAANLRSNQIPAGLTITGLSR